jgi:hypothetical protein
MLSYREKEITGERLALNDREAVYLGPGLRLNKCEIVLDTNRRALTIKDVNFFDCEIIAKKKFSSFQWDKARLQACRFMGIFQSNDFGPWLETGNNSDVQDCDFSNATMDGCRFLGSTGRSNTLPHWPCFTIFNPRERSTDLVELPWRGPMVHIVGSFSMYPENTSAVTFHYPSLVKQEPFDEIELRGLLEKAGNVYF